MHKLNAIKNAKNRLPVPEAYLLTVLGIEQLDLTTEREEKFLVFFCKKRLYCMYA